MQEVSTAFVRLKIVNPNLGNPLHGPKRRGFLAGFCKI